MPGHRTSLVHIETQQAPSKYRLSFALFAMGSRLPSLPILRALKLLSTRASTGQRPRQGLDNVGDQEASQSRLCISFASNGIVHVYSSGGSIPVRGCTLRANRAAGGRRKQAGTLLDVFRGFPLVIRAECTRITDRLTYTNAPSALNISRHDEPLAPCIVARSRGGTYLSVKTGVLSVRLLLHGRSSPSTWSRSCSPSRISSRPSLLRLPVRRHRLLAISHGGSASTVQVGQQYILHSQQSGCKPTQTGWLPVTVSCSLVRSEERWPCSPL